MNTALESAPALAATGFDEEWDRCYRASTHLSVWPWSDVVSLTHRHASPANGYSRVLELGCGAGANIPFYLSLPCEYHAIDGSAAILAQLLARYPALQGRLLCGDFTRPLPWADASFDLVLDRASITHNRTADVQAALAQAARVLRPGGKFIGSDWFSSAHEDAGHGTRVDDHTRRDIDSRNFGGVGNVHFSDEAHLRALFGAAGFALEMLQHKEHRHVVGGKGAHFASWNLVAVKG